MNITYIITELTPAGAERIVASLVQQMSVRGHSCSVISLMPRPENTGIVEQFERNGVPVKFLNAKKRDAWKLPFLLRKAIRDFEPDVVHAHLMHPNLLSRIALFGTDIPLVNTIHISEHRAGYQRLFFMDRLTFSLADAVTAVSRTSAEFHARMCGLPETAIQVIENGIQPVIPANTDECHAMMQKCGLMDCSKIIGSIGRLNQQKGFDRLLSALPELANRVPAGEKWGILIFGEGEDRPKLEQMISEFKDARLKIALPGFRTDASSLMTLFHAFVMPSRYEGYGLALSEAMTLGLPVVISGCDSLPGLCAKYHGFCASVDFEAQNWKNELADSLAHAVQAPRSAPYLHNSCGQMAADYEFLYSKLTKE